MDLAEVGGRDVCALGFPSLVSLSHQAGDKVQSRHQCGFCVVLSWGGLLAHLHHPSLAALQAPAVLLQALGHAPPCSDKLQGCFGLARALVLHL